MQGHEVVGEANSGQKAIQKARELKPDIILMDIAMPGEIDGIEAIERIKKEQDVAVIFITAYSENMYQGRLESLDGNYSYLVKPFNTDQLKSALDSVMQ
jgi:YesN/AraC family two-component response regulator